MTQAGQIVSAPAICWRIASKSPRSRLLRRALLAGALAAVLIATAPVARADAAEGSPQDTRQTLDRCIADRLPPSGSEMLSMRCGELKFCGVATVRIEHGTKTCLFGPIVSPSEGERLGALPEYWRSFPFARVRFERSEVASDGEIRDAAASDGSWVVEVPEWIVGLIAEGDCTVGRYDVDLEADGTRPPGFKTYTGFAEMASTHQRALEGWELAARVRSTRAASIAASADEAVRHALDEARVAAERASRAWLDRGTCLPPPYALLLIAWIEEMDARQYLYRALGEVKAADRVAESIYQHAQAIGANGLMQLVRERVPAAQDGPTSLCLHRCWVTDASEVRAVGTREYRMQKRFIADLRAAVSRESECGKQVVEAAGHWFDRLLGTLPPGSRFDPRLAAIVSDALGERCGKDRSERSLHAVAMTVSLKAYAACWSESIDRYPDISQRVEEWHETLRREIVAMLESPAWASALPPEDMPQVMVRALERLEGSLRDRDNYFMTFPPSPALQRQVIAEYRAFAGGRGFQGLDSSEANRGKVAARVTQDLLESLHEVTALNASKPGGADAYPRPFPFFPQSFKMWGQEMKWSVGL